MSFMSQILEGTVIDSREVEKVEVTNELNFDIADLSETEKRIWDSLDSLPEVSKIEISHPINGHGLGVYGCFQGDNLIGGLVSKDYPLVSANRIKQACLAASHAFDGSSVTVKTGWRDGYAVSIQPDQGHRRAIFGTDEVNPGLSIVSPLGGKGKTKGSLFAFRDACSNMAMLQRIQETNFNMRHDSGHDSKFSGMVAGFRRISSNWDNAIETMQKMHEEKINLSHFFENVFASKKKADGNVPTNTTNTIKAMIGRISREQKELEGTDIDLTSVSGWLAWNGIQGHFQHPKKTDSNRHRNNYENALQVARKPEVDIAEDYIFDLLAA